MNQQFFAVAPAAIRETSIALLWNKEESASEYWIHKDGAKIDITTVTDYTLENLESGKSYEFQVKRYDKNGVLINSSKVIKESAGVPFVPFVRKTFI